MTYHPNNTPPKYVVELSNTTRYHNQEDEIEANGKKYILSYDGNNFKITDKLNEKFELLFVCGCSRNDVMTCFNALEKNAT